jgi:hypothetical protein
MDRTPALRRPRTRTRVLTILGIISALSSWSQASRGTAGADGFEDVTDQVGLTFTHVVSEVPGSLTQRAGGGIAAADYDGDGDTDLYVIGGDGGENALFRNDGGTFTNVAEDAGVALAGTNGSGPLFFDYDGDGFPDLFVGGTDGSAPVLFHNLGGSRFEDVTARAGLGGVGITMSATAGDYDGDGWLDLFLSHWGSVGQSCHVWRNLHGERFQCMDGPLGIPDFTQGLTVRSFSGNFVDIDRDGRQDLLVTSDFGTSRVLRNHGSAGFVPWDSPVISDENGMGAAIGDYDGDGAIDWFVTSIWDGDGVTEGDWGTTGNRMYRNLGDGTFEDTTDVAGVRQGDWAWAACFADFDQDGVLDLVHVTGWPQGSAQFRDTPARLFVGRGDGSFDERAAELGFDEHGNGRGLVCFDYDGDGDIDLAVMNNDGPLRLWQNDGGSALGNFLAVKLEAPAPNVDAIGARITVRVGGSAQVRLIRGGTNYASQDPPEAHFGLGAAGVIDSLSIEWPDGQTTTLEQVAVNQRLVVKHEARPPAPRMRSPGCSMSP